MIKREKILVAVTGLVAATFVTYLAINRVFLMPAAERYERARELATRIGEAQQKKAREKTYRQRLEELAGRTFGSDELRVSEEVRSRITTVLTRSGLSAEKLTLKPVVGGRAPGVYKEIGWLVRVRGAQEQIINFLHLMKEEPHLHRLENVVLTPMADTSEMDLQVKYATLVLEPRKGEQLATGTVADEVPDGALEGTRRAQYEVIATRDLFRPYIQARRRPDEAPPGTPQAPTSPQSPEVPVGQYRLVGLPTWAGKTDVLVRDSASGNVASYKAGDDLAGGRIVAVDYRPMPLPGNPEILSGSRVVLQIGSQYYAVELGRYLAEKYALEADRVPPELPKLEAAPAPVPTPAPAGPPQAAEAQVAN